MKLHDDLLANMPEGARHDSDICPFCVDKATESGSTASRIPPAGDSGPDVSENQTSPTNTEGGTPHTMSDTITKETHEALLQKAVADATSATESALAKKTEEAKELAEKLEKANADAASLKADNDRLNNELDTAQVNLKKATDEVAALKDDIAAKDEAARKVEVASKRAEQVKNLGLFDDEYVAEKASSWADLADEDWADRVADWQKLKPATAGTTKSTDTASALTGTDEKLTKEPPVDAASETTKTPARRAALGLI